MEYEPGKETSAIERHAYQCMHHNQVVDVSSLAYPTPKLRHGSSATNPMVGIECHNLPQQVVENLAVLHSYRFRHILTLLYCWLEIHGVCSGT
jgi:hypothetical protein